MFSGRSGEPQDWTVAFEELHGDKERGHHVDRPALEPEMRRDVIYRSGVRLEPGEEIQARQRRDHHVGGVQLVAHAIEGERVSVRSAREVGHDW